MIGPGADGGSLAATDLGQASDQGTGTGVGRASDWKPLADVNQATD